MTGKTCNYVPSPAAKVAEVVNISSVDESGLIAAVGAVPSSPMCVYDNKLRPLHTTTTTSGYYEFTY